jgi:hypothetical protein
MKLSRVALASLLSLASQIFLIACLPEDPPDSPSPGESELSSAVVVTTEELANGLDDNGNGKIDEPTLRYGIHRPLETQTYAQLPTVSLWISDAATRAHLDNLKNLTVRYQLTYQALSAASQPAAISGIESMMITPNWRNLKGAALLALNPNSPTRGLAPMTVYRFKLQLFNSFNVPLGAQSDWFYSVTAGTSSAPNDTIKWSRVDLALQALHEVGDSQAGLVGLGGTLEPDGTRYTGSAFLPQHPSYHGPADDTAWCDWFVHYVGVRVTDGLDGSIAAHQVADGGNTFWHTMNPNAVPNSFRDPRHDGCGTERVDLDGNGVVGDKVQVGCQDYSSLQVSLDTADNQFYSNIPNNIYYDAIKSRPQNQGMSNYQAMDSHAGMFLAFDPNGDGTSTGSGTIGTVWSVEGNVSHHNSIMHRASDNPVINGYGKLTLSMVSP